MSINKFNCEGYYDPTAYEDLTNIEREEKAAKKPDFKTADDFRPLVYICSPYAGDTNSNIKAAQKYSQYAVAKGYIPFAPHLLFPQFLNDADPNERQLGLSFGNILMSKCAEVWVFGKRISAGMESEINRAKCEKYRLRYFIENCQEVHD